MTTLIPALLARGPKVSSNCRLASTSGAEKHPPDHPAEILFSD